MIVDRTGLRPAPPAEPSGPHRPRLASLVDRRLVICAIASIAGHVALVVVLTSFVQGDEPPPPAPQIVQVHVVEPPAPEPPPEPVKPPEAVPQEPPKPKLHERPRPKAPAQVKHDITPVDTPPVDHPPTTTDTTTTPVFGVTMESTSQGGSGPAMPVGNTTRPAPAGTTGAAVKPLAPPVAAVEVTKMPLPHGRCAGKYTEEALAAGVEGVVVLDVTVDEHGHARDITVVQGLSHGLTAAAIAALGACTFTPGEKDGAPVPVRVRGYKVRFIPPDSP